MQFLPYLVIYGNSGALLQAIVEPKSVIFTALI